MASGGEVVCSNCGAPIALDTTVCPCCGFTFGKGQVGAALGGRRKESPPADLTPAPVLSRRNASLLAAGGFGLYVGILALVVVTTPVVGIMIYGALYFASPFTWGWGLIAGVDAPWPIDRTYLPLAFAAPYPIVGLLVGYAWPFPVRSFGQAARAIGMRFALSILVLGVIGSLLFVAGLPRSSYCRLIAGC
jgi:hypothetical protein